MNGNENTIIARWETKGKDFLELSRVKSDLLLNWYSYRGNGCGGSFQSPSDECAIAQMEYPWGHPAGTGQVTVLRADRPSLRRSDLTSDYADGLTIREELARCDNP
jgi:hypothetical protein